MVLLILFIDGGSGMWEGGLLLLLQQKNGKLGVALEKTDGRR